MQSVYPAIPTDWVTGYMLGESYSSVEMQLVYAAAPTNWAMGHTSRISYYSVEIAVSVSCSTQGMGHGIHVGGV